MNAQGRVSVCSCWHCKTGEARLVGSHNLPQDEGSLPNAARPHHIFVAHFHQDRRLAEVVRDEVGKVAVVPLRIAACRCCTVLPSQAVERHRLRMSKQ
jgi:hypothetical protein